MPCLIHSSKGVETPSRFLFSQKRLLSLPYVQFYSERIEIFELERTYPFSDIIRESSNIPIWNYQVENFC